MTAHKELLQSYNKFINHIPFIKLGHVDDVAGMAAEALQIYQEYSPSALLSKHPDDETYTGVDVLGIYDYKGLPISRYGETYLSENNKDIVPDLTYQFGEKTELTEIGVRLPKISAAIEDIVEYPGRVRLSKLRANSSGGWHSHGRDPLFEIVLHIPLITNEQVTAQVGYCSMLWEESKYRYHVPDTYETTCFRAGEIWLLNGMMSHRVVNASEVDRVHVWMQGHFVDHHKRIVNAKLLQMLTSALTEYQGPYIQPM